MTTEITEIEEGSAAHVKRKIRELPENGEFQAFITRQSLPDSAISELRESTREILGDAEHYLKQTNTKATGLVVGQVQSGKTTSFIATCAAAIDIGYKIIIVLSGTSLSLTDQTVHRLRHKTKGLNPDKNSKIRLIHQPTINSRNICQQTLEGAGTKDVLLFTCLKHTIRMADISALLKELLADKPDLKVLIIDDESDSYSLDTSTRARSRGKPALESATHKNLKELRDSCNRHVYLGYTATPQAVSLIPVHNHLSPDFCQVLKAGEDYTGGSTFFSNGGRNNFIEIISPDELAKGDALQVDDPPETLISAFEYFLMVASIDKEEGDSADGIFDQNRTMMVHPDSTNKSHAVHAQWVSAHQSELQDIFLDPNDPDYLCVKERFRKIHQDLVKQKATTSSFESVFEICKRITSDLVVVETNQRNKVDFEHHFEDNYASVICGGNNLDRGFTVEGLVVTWLARNAKGAPNADTMQQRARFFGYRKNLLRFCKIYLSGDMCYRFVKYTQHELSMHNWLKENRHRLNDPETIRRFVLDPSMRPTRLGVYSKDYSSQKNWAWLAQKSLLNSQNEPDNSTHQLNQVIKEIQERHGTNFRTITSDAPWIKSGGSHGSPHQELVVPYSEFKRYLVSIIGTLRIATDVAKFQAAIDALEIISNPDYPEYQDARNAFIDQPCHIYLMRPGSKRDDVKFESGHSKNYQVGADPSRNYLGDKKVQRGPLSLQIHSLLLKGQTTNIPGICLGCSTELKKVLPTVIMQNQRT